MRILFIGGTRFVGLAMAREALRRGHQVDLFHRGSKIPAGLEGAVHLQGDRASDLAALKHGNWDAVIDTCGYRPRDIVPVSEALAGRGGRYVFVSSVSVYAEDIPHGADETAARAATQVLDGQDLATVAVTGETYGALKVLCEDEVLARHPDALILRPTYVIGPEDYTTRFSEWVRRLAAGGEVDAPGPPDAAVQTIDTRDLAGFTIGAIEQQATGTFNVAAPRGPYSFGEMLQQIAEGVAPSGTRLRWLTAEEARASGQSFPLWHNGESYGVAAVSSAAAYANGLTCRPVSASAADVLAWLQRDATT